MPIHQFLSDRTYDPETIAMMDKAFEGACTDLGVTDQTPYSRALVAKQILMLAHSKCDAEAIRACVVAFLRTRH